LQRHRRIIQDASVVVEDTPEISKIEPEKISNVPVVVLPEIIEDTLDKRRQNARIKKNASDDEDQELPLEVEEDIENDEESSSVSGSDSEGGKEDWDQFAPSKVPKPRFIKKEKRQTIQEKEQAQKEEERIKEEKEKQIQEKKERTKHLLKEAMERERTALKVEEEIAVSDDDDDEETQQNEYELWKLRELVRIRRERDEREKWRLERLDVERRRSMTDDEVAAEKRKNKEGYKEKKFMKYLQKYYHKGAFYHEDLKTLQDVGHDWTAATGEDKWIDRTMLPKVMQVKNFGRAGRTKYTHLKNEDTSKLDDPWATITTNPQYLQKIGGVGGFDRPTKKRKVTTAPSSSNTNTNT